jgi:hypothetical protein
VPASYLRVVHDSLEPRLEPTTLPGPGVAPRTKVTGFIAVITKVGNDGHGAGNYRRSACF